MSKKIALLSLGYWFSSTNLGMVLHPYKTIRDITRKKNFLPMIFSPLVWMVVFWLMAIGCILGGRFIANQVEIVYPWWFYAMLEFVFWWVIWYLVFLQLLVGYLYARFKRALE